MTGWQPIETAPKDEYVLVFVAPDIGVARYYPYVFTDGGWWQWDWEASPSEIHPTHWMPLPEPPCA